MAWLHAEKMKPINQRENFAFKLNFLQSAPYPFNVGI